MNFFGNLFTRGVEKKCDQLEKMDQFRLEADQVGRHFFRDEQWY